MNPILKNILALLAGWIIGSIVNMALVQTGYIFFPLEGVDTSDMEALATAMHNAETTHFIFPFLAHALGTLIGAFFTALIAANHKAKLAFAIGILFLVGGIMVSFMLPAPLWFIILDLVIAYLPMAWIGGKLALHYNK